MRKLFLSFAIVAIATIASVKALGLFETKGLSEIGKENVKALADWVNISDCLDNCSNYFHGEYCCTVRVGNNKIDPCGDKFLKA